MLIRINLFGFGLFVSASGHKETVGGTQGTVILMEGADVMYVRQCFNYLLDMANEQATGTATIATFPQQG